MKKLFWLTAFALAAVAVRAGIVEETKSKPVLAGSLVVAPFEEVGAKVAKLGAMINNPLVPMLLGTAMQQGLTQSYGAFNSALPMCWLSYVQTPAWEVAMTNDDMVAFSELHDVALVYPSVDKAAMMLLNNPGSTKAADGTLHLLASETRPKPQYVAFAKDGRYCAFASSAALAKRALDDFGKVVPAAGGAGKAGPLVRLSLTERGIEAIACAKGMKAVMKKYVGADLSVDLDDKGVSIAGSVAARSGVATVPVAACAFDPKTLEKVPASAPLFFAGSEYVANGCMTDAEFKAYVEERVKVVEEAIRQTNSDPSTKPYRKFMKEMSDAVVELMRKTSAPKPGDWSVGAIAFDAAGRPGAVISGVAENAKGRSALVCVALSKIAAAMKRQFPKFDVVVEKGEGVYEFDFAALIDLAAAQEGIKLGDEAYKALAPAKENVKAIFGDTKFVVTMKCNGNSYSETAACSSFTPPAAGGVAAKRISAVLPEVDAERPALVFHGAVYAFLRDIVLPRAVKLMDVESDVQVKTLIDALPPANPESGVAGAMWVRGDGAMRFQVRMAGDELKNFGALFNAYTAAMTSAAMGDDDDDEEE